MTTEVFHFHVYLSVFVDIQVLSNENWKEMRKLNKFFRYDFWKWKTITNDRRRERQKNENHFSSATFSLDRFTSGAALNVDEMSKAEQSKSRISFHFHHLHSARRRMRKWEEMRKPGTKEFCFRFWSERRGNTRKYKSGKIKIEKYLWC